MFALLAAASAQWASVNPYAAQYAVPATHQNLGYAVENSGYGAYVPQAYAAHAYAPKVLAAQAYAAPAAVSRDYSIEKIGERHGYSNGPASFQYSFLKGADLGQQGVAVQAAPVVSSVVSPVETYASYGVPHHNRVVAAQPGFETVNPFAGVLATGGQQVFAQQLVSPQRVHVGQYRAHPSVVKHFK